MNRPSTDLSLVRSLRAQGLTKQEVTAELRNRHKDMSPTYLTRKVERLCGRYGLTWVPPEPPTTG